MLTNGAIKAVTTVQRKAEVRAADPAQHTTRRSGAIAEAAAGLSRRNVATARTELANEALRKLIELCYEEIEGELVNVDAHTQRILVPMPWGRLGSRSWGLRNSEAVILRSIMLARLASERNLPELWQYDPIARSWLCDIRSYGSIQSALRWFKNHGEVSLSEWRHGEQVWRDGRAGIFRSDGQ